MAVALGCKDAHFDSVVAKVGAEIEKHGGLFDLLAGSIFNDGSCLAQSKRYGGFERFKEWRRRGGATNDGIKHGGFLPAANLIKIFFRSGVTATYIKQENARQ